MKCQICGDEPDSCVEGPLRGRKPRWAQMDGVRVIRESK